MATSDELLESMDEAGIEKSVVMSFGWSNADDCSAGNEYTMEASVRSGGRLLPFIAVSPASELRAAQEIENCASAGARGVGELYAEGQGFDVGELQTLIAVLHACMESDIFLCVHVSEPIGHHYPGKDSTNPVGLWRFLSVAPTGLKLLLPHWGGGFGFYELMPEVAEHTATCYYDCSASHLLYDSRVYAIMSHLAPDRVLFGSDFPLTAQNRMVRRVTKADLTPPQLAAIFAANAVKAGLA